MRKYLILFLLVFPLLLHAQEQEPPKIGLVLSGGGAKGLAHIGALKVIEEAGIKIDYIGGTSMGAIVGALYASGYSATQLDSIFHEINFNILIQDDVPRSAKTFYEKEETEKYAITLPFDDFQIKFPSGLSRGQNIYNLISRLTVHLGDVRDFSELPIPFFCIAANIESGEEVILDSGSLPQAVSASGAIPTLFNPVRLDGKLLTDGGVVNNYPVEELRRRGAEIVIGVDVQDTLMNREQLRSAFDILTQISNFRTIHDMREKVELTDIYIKPEISKYSILSFERGGAIIKAGEEATRARLMDLELLAARQGLDYKPRGKKTVVDSINIASLTIEGNNSYPREYILGKMRLRYNSQYTMEDLSRGINNLAATGNFNRINYNLIPVQNAYTLALQLEESRSKTFLRLSLHYDDLYKSGALVNLTRKSNFFTNDVASLDVVLGDNFRYNFHYYLDKGYYWSVGARSRYNSFHKGVSYDLVFNEPPVNAIGGINRVEIDYREVTNQLYVETLFQQIISFGIGLEHRFLRISSETISPVPTATSAVTDFDRTHYYSAFGYLLLDSYDDKYFPSRGVSFEGNSHIYVLSSSPEDVFSEFSITRGQLGYAFMPVNRLTARISSETGFRIGNYPKNTLNFFLGGYGNDILNNVIPFFGYDFISLSGDSYIKGLVELDYEFLRSNHIIASANFANVEDDLYSTGNWLSLPDYSGYALGYGLESLFGPIEVKYSWSPEVRSVQWFFSLGFWF